SRRIVSGAPSSLPSMASPRASTGLPRAKQHNQNERTGTMKPLIPIAVVIGLLHGALPALPLSPDHPLQPSAPRSVTLVESQAPPIVRAGLLQSTLIVLPAEEKVANVFAGDTVDWVFDGGHVASRFISSKPKGADGSTHVHIVSTQGN